MLPLEESCNNETAMTVSYVTRARWLGEVTKHNNKLQNAIESTLLKASESTISEVPHWRFTIWINNKTKQE